MRVTTHSQVLPTRIAKIDKGFGPEQLVRTAYLPRPMVMRKVKALLYRRVGNAVQIVTLNLGGA